MRNRKLVCYITIIIIIVFILLAIIDRMWEYYYPSLGVFGYKPLYLFILKLIYTFILFSGVVRILKKKKYGLFLLLFSSIGLITEYLFFYLIDYHFRSFSLDYFLLEFLSIFLIFYIWRDFIEKGERCVRIFILITFIAGNISIIYSLCKFTLKLY